MGSLIIEQQEYKYDLCAIDGDAIIYRGGFAVKEGEPVSHAIYNCRLILEGIREDCLAKKELMYLTSNDKSNFRFARAKTPRVVNKGKPTEYTLQGYKENRKGSDKPLYYNETREWLEGDEGAIMVFGEEADDAMARAATQCEGKAIISTHDKDLNMVPVDIYNIPKREIHVFEGDGLWLEKGKIRGRGRDWFYAQLLMGDSGDNIPGIPGYGPAKAYKALKDCENEQEMVEVTTDIYFSELTEDHTFQQVKDRYLEIADLLWMRGTCNIEDMGLYLESNYFNKIGE